jgi:hypothetical protein
MVSMFHGASQFDSGSIETWNIVHLTDNETSNMLCQSALYGLSIPQPQL